MGAVTAPATAGDLMRFGPVIAVLTIDRVADAIPLARALVVGGIRALEVTLRTSVAIAAIEAIATDVPEAVVGAGTVLNAQALARAEAAGARFIVSPGLTDALLRAAGESALPFLPGVATVSELMRGLEAGLDHFKFFPAEAAGGPAMLKALHAPFGHARFCPTGGLTADNARAYLALPNVPCIGGGWVAPEALIAARNWSRVTDLAKEASALRA